MNHIRTTFVYNHFEVLYTIARRFRPVAHTESAPRFFRAFGLEDLTELRTAVGRATGPILIAIDGHESTLHRPTPEQLFRRREYAFILAAPVRRQESHTLFETTERMHQLAAEVINQIRRPLRHTNPQLEFQTNGIGPIADNFYGILVTFALQEPAIDQLTPDLWD